MLGMTALACLFAVLKSDHWEASQALTVRPEAIGSEGSQGRFADLDQMKTIQETILELIKSRGVLHATLQSAGPPETLRKGTEWPSERDVALLRDRVRISPPKGAEFGKTEVFYLRVEDLSRTRAIQLVNLLCAQLESRFKALRDAKAQSLIAELSHAEALARTELQAATEELAGFEDTVGTDLAELRLLHASAAGTSDIRQNLVALENELRNAETEYRRNNQLAQSLRDALNDTQRLVATPNSLLESQPALRRLKEGLIDAQLRTASLSGTMTEEHPLVRAARQAEEETRGHLFQELSIALDGVEMDLKLSSDRVASLSAGLAASKERLERLAGLRAHYANLTDAAQDRADQLEAARRKLADAKAAEAAALEASLIGKIDSVDGGIRPVGPRRATIVLAGMSAGLLIGLGLVFMSVSEQQERRTDSTAGGSRLRRSTDQVHPSTATTPSETARPTAVVLPSLSSHAGQNGTAVR
jgi:uncharacterized protein involved in exopolysaccharide biosynthesis